MPEQQQSFQRQIAYKVRISDILNAHLSKDNLSLYAVINNSNVSRVNVISTLVHKAEDASYSSAIMDDGTGRLSLRSFERKDIFSKVDVGDAVLIIGRLREFNNERYIIPEIVKKVDNSDWINVRKFELRNNITTDFEKGETKNEMIEESVFVVDEVLSLIKKLDSGEGVLIDDIVKESGKDDIEKTLNRMLENGEIFVIKPGKVKVLE